MSDQGVFLSKWPPNWRIILAKEQLGHSYIFWTMPILIFCQFANFGNQSLGFDFHSNLNPKLENQFLNGLYRHHRFWPFTDTLKFSENWSYHISVIREFSVKSSREKWYSKEHVGEIRKVRIPKIRLTHMFHPNDIFLDAVEGP